MKIPKTAMDMSLLRPDQAMALLERSEAKYDALRALVGQFENAAEMLWIVLANVSGSDWTLQSPEWQEAAAKFRDQYFAALTALRAAVEGE